MRKNTNKLDGLKPVRSPACMGGGGVGAGMSQSLILSRGAAGS